MNLLDVATSTRSVVFQSRDGDGEGAQDKAVCQQWTGVPSHWPEVERLAVQTKPTSIRSRWSKPLVMAPIETQYDYASVRYITLGY
jgi:hypothetical protein